MSSPVIVARSISKVFEIYETPLHRLKQILFGRFRSFHRKFKALDGVSFEVLRGQSVGVVGRNGAGKSTLLQILTGTLQASQGEMEISGRVAAVLELGSGFNPEFTGRQNIYMYASLFGLTRDQCDQRFSRIVDFSGLQDFIDQPVKTYSSGMQARLAFSVIAHVDADILIIDEALSVGDAVFTQKCMRFLRDFQRHGTILFVSHDMGAVTGFCDRAIWLEKGQVVAQGPAKDICERYYAFTQTELIGVAGESASEARSPTVPRKSSLRSSRVLLREEASLQQGDIAKGLQSIESFGFDLKSASHGNGDARIFDVQLFSAHGGLMNVVEGGQAVQVRIDVEAIRDVPMPIVGFIIKDRLGQPLIGGNTFHTYKSRPVAAAAGEFWEVIFEFRMPILAVGDYSVVAAIGNGTLEQHVHLHWLHDALHFKVVSTSIEGVIVGVPLDRIDFVAYARDPASQ